MNLIGFNEKIIIDKESVMSEHEPIPHTIDEGWKKSLKWHSNKIQENKGIIILTPEKQSIKTFGILFEVPDSVKFQIKDWLDINLPPQFGEYIIRQPADGYHISLEWTEQENIPKEIQDEVMIDIKSGLAKFSKLPMDIALLYPSFVNMFAPCLINNEALEELRNELRSIFTKHNLRIGIPPEVYGAWVSLIRYKKQLPSELIHELQKLPKDTIPEVVLDKILFTINDPMFTKEKSTVLEQMTLR